MQNVTLHCFWFLATEQQQEHGHDANYRMERESLKQCPKMQACDSAWRTKVTCTSHTFNPLISMSHPGQSDVNQKEPRREL